VSRHRLIPDGDPIETMGHWLVVFLAFVALSGLLAVAVLL
jgi:hypothetical protein